MVEREAKPLRGHATREKGGKSFTTAGLCICEPKLNSALNPASGSLRNELLVWAEENLTYA